MTKCPLKILASTFGEGTRNLHPQLMTKSVLEKLKIEDAQGKTVLFGKKTCMHL